MAPPPTRLQQLSSRFGVGFVEAVRDAAALERVPQFMRTSEYFPRHLDELELRLKLFVKRDALFSDPQRGGSFLAPGGKSRWPAARFGAARGQRRGRPIIVTEPDSDAARTIDAVADKLLDMSARRIRLPVVNIAKPS